MGGGEPSPLAWPLSWWFWSGSHLPTPSREHWPPGEPNRRMWLEVRVGSELSLED